MEASNNTEYYLTSSTNWLIDYAAALEGLTGQKVKVQNNILRFPSKFGKGSLEVLELAPGLSITLIDCVLLSAQSFFRQGSFGNDHIITSFNLGTSAAKVTLEDGSSVTTGNRFENAIMLSSHSKGVSSTFEKGTHLKGVTLIFHINWLLEVFATSDVALRHSRISRLAKNLPMQFFGNMDVKIKSLVEEFFNKQYAGYSRTKYFEGMSLQLMALFLNSQQEIKIDEERVISSSVTRVIKFKKILDALIENGDAQLPTVEMAAAMSDMSTTTFMNLFHSIYERTYASYTKSALMQLAATRILSGWSVMQAGKSIGYVHLGHFATAFAKEFGLTPKKYFLKNR